MIRLTAPFQASPQATLPQRAAAAGIQAYKDYVSPYLDVHCRFHPTCSAYTYEAIADYGVLKGSAMGALRLARCNAESGGGSDPVPHAHSLETLPPAPASSARPSLPSLVSSGKAVLVDASPFKMGLAEAARLLVGGSAAAMGALVGGLVGACTGAVMGAAAGSHHLDALNQRIASELGSQSVVGAAILERAVGQPGHRVFLAASHVLPAPAAQMVGGVAGALSGLVLGGLGGACKVATGSARMLGLMAYHLVLAKTGAEIPAGTAVPALSGASQTVLGATPSSQALPDSPSSDVRHVEQPLPLASALTTPGLTTPLQETRS